MPGDQVELPDERVETPGPWMQVRHVFLQPPQRPGLLGSHLLSLGCQEAVGGGVKRSPGLPDDLQQKQELPVMLSRQPREILLEVEQLGPGVIERGAWHSHRHEAVLRRSGR